MSEDIQALSLSVQAAVTNYHRLGVLNSKLLLLTVPRLEVQEEGAGRSGVW